MDKHRIDEIKSKLKEEFIGLEKEIDKLVNHITLYKELKDTLTRPYIINVWGMTGYGKTTLVNRVTELLGLTTLHINSSDINSDKESFFFSDEICDFIDSEYSCFIFDEFHNAKTRDGIGDVEINASLKAVWGLMDDGTFINEREVYKNIACLKSCIKILEYSIKNGYKVDYAKNLCDFYIEANTEDEALELIRLFESIAVTEYGGLYIKQRGRDGSEGNVVKVGFYGDIFRIPFCNLYKSEGDVITGTSKLLQSINSIEEAIDFLKVIDKDSSKLYRMNFSNSLIINIGNLDSVYDLTNEHYTDISIEECSDYNGTISDSDINDALSELFRAEHLSRLGTNHIMFPIYSEEQFRGIIAKYLNKRVDTFREKGYDFVIEDNVYTYILRKLTYVTLGVRNVIVTIESLMIDILSYCIDNEISDKVLIDITQYGVILINGQESSIVKRKIKKEATDNEKALTAVHEAGHFLIYNLLTGKIPSKLTCVTDVSGANGFMGTKVKDRKRYTDWIELRNEVCVCLAGILAEHVIFHGGDKVKFSMGGSSDIEIATKLLGRAFRDCGFSPYYTSDKVLGLSTHYGCSSEDGKYAITDDGKRSNDFITFFIDKYANEVLKIFEDILVKSYLIDFSKKLFKEETLMEEDLRIMSESIYDAVREKYKSKEVGYYEKLFRS